MNRLLAAARRVFRRRARPVAVTDHGMWESNTCATLHRHWIAPLDRE